MLSVVQFPFLPFPVTENVCCRNTITAVCNLGAHFSSASNSLDFPRHWQCQFMTVCLFMNARSTLYSWVYADEQNKTHHRTSIILWQLITLHAAPVYIYKVLTVYFMSLKSKYYQICHIPTSTYWVRRIKGEDGSVSDAPALSLCCKPEPACNCKTLLAYFLPQSAAASHIIRQGKQDNQ